MTREWFINQLENIHKISFGVKSIDSSSLDVLFDEDGNEYNQDCIIDSRVLNPETKTFEKYERFDYKKGVTPFQLQRICEQLDISVYAYDCTKNLLAHMFPRMQIIHH